jgi:hypothetical protein
MCYHFNFFSVDNIVNFLLIAIDSDSNSFVYRTCDTHLTDNICVFNEIE